MRIRYKKEDKKAVIPTRATTLSGGLDLTATRIQKVSENEVIVYIGLAMQPPPGYMIRFSPRSSFTGYNWVLQNSPTLGDADFTGEYRLRFRAIPTGVKGFFFKKKLTYDVFPYNVGDRVAQMWLEKIVSVIFEEGELENLTERKGGFGSTGK
jgi:deoxyuridine 5'-triphosphate nucleotidohydrolase